MGLTGLSDLANRLSGGGSAVPDNGFWFKTPSASSSPGVGLAYANRWTSLWQFDGLPGGGSPAGGMQFCLNSLEGSIFLDEGVGTQILLGGTCFGQTQGTLMVYDRLLQCGELTGDETNPQAVDPDTVAFRYVSADPRGFDSAWGNLMFIEIYDELGPDPVNVEVDYKGVDGQTYTSAVFQIGGDSLKEAQRLIPIPIKLAVKQTTTVPPIGFVEVRLSDTTNGRGAFGLTLLRPLMFIPVTTPNTSTLIDLIATDPAVVHMHNADPCIALAFMPMQDGTESSFEFCGNLAVVSTS